MQTAQMPKIGVVIVASASRAVNIAAQVKDTVKMLKMLENVRVIQVNEIVTNPRQAEKAAQRLKNENVDLLLLQIGSYAADGLSVEIVKRVAAPLLLWGVPEPLLKGDIKTGGLVGYVQSAGVISKLGRDFKFIFGYPDAGKILKDIAASVRVAGTIKQLSACRIGLLGHRCPGMLDEGFHELELRRWVGPEVVPVDLSDLISRVKSMDKKRIKKESVATIAKFGKLEGPTQADLAEGVSLYLALQDLAKQSSFQALAVKCWPELMGAGLMAPCLALSRLNDDGIMAGCEGDVTATVTMLILHYLTGKQVFLGDLFEMNEESNTFFLYHCGAAPSKLAADISDVKLRMHFRKYKPLDPMVLKPGVITDFSIKPGLVTFARLTEKQGKYRLLIMQGEAVVQENIIGGNGARVKMDANVRETLKTIVAEGIEHHQLMVHADVKEELVELCRCLKIEPILV